MSALNSSWKQIRVFITSPHLAWIIRCRIVAKLNHIILTVNSLNESLALIE